MALGISLVLEGQEALPTVPGLEPYPMGWVNEWRRQISKASPLHPHDHGFRQAGDAEIFAADPPTLGGGEMGRKRHRSSLGSNKP